MEGEITFGSTRSPQSPTHPTFQIGKIIKHFAVLSEQRWVLRKHPSAPRRAYSSPGWRLLMPLTFQAAVASSPTARRSRDRAALFACLVTPMTLKALGNDRMAVAVALLAAVVV